MARIIVLFLLIEALVVVAMAKNEATLATPTAPVPSTSNVKQDTAENKIRRMGKHRHNLITRSSAAPCLSPSEAHLATNHSEDGSILNQENATTQVQELKIKKEKRHHSVDRSVAGAGVILGGLATAFFAAIACYIRATRRKNTEPASPNSVTSPTISKV